MGYVHYCVFCGHHRRRGAPRRCCSRRARVRLCRCAPARRARYRADRRVADRPARSPPTPRFDGAGPLAALCTIPVRPAVHRRARSATSSSRSRWCSSSSPRCWRRRRSRRADEPTRRRGAPTRLAASAAAAAVALAIALAVADASLKPPCYVGSLGSVALLPASRCTCARGFTTRAPDTILDIVPAAAARGRGGRLLRGHPRLPRRRHAAHRGRRSSTSSRSCWPACSSPPAAGVRTCASGGACGDHDRSCSSRRRPRSRPPRRACRIGDPTRSARRCSRSARLAPRRRRDRRAPGAEPRGRRRRRRTSPSGAGSSAAGRHPDRSGRRLPAAVLARRVRRRRRRARGRSLWFGAAFVLVRPARLRAPGLPRRRPPPRGDRRARASAAAPSAATRSSRR